MSTRSPMNKRNQERPIGMTRKSAGSAKPARQAAAGVHVVPASSKEKRKQLERGEDLSGLSKEEKRARKQEIRRQEDRIYTVSTMLAKDDPDYVTRRRKFWFAMAMGLVCIAAGWVMLMVFGSDAKGIYQYMELGAIGLAYVFIIGSFIYDMVRIRPVRNRARAMAEGMSDAKITEMLEKSVEQEEATRAEREAKKLARRKK